MDTIEFHPTCGRVLYLDESKTLAVKNVESDEDALVFTQTKLQDDEMVIVTILKKTAENPLATNFKVGVTTVDPNSIEVIPKHIEDLLIISPTWWIFSNMLASSRNSLGTKYSISIDALRIGDDIGIKRSASGSLEFFINDQTMGVAEKNAPEDLYIVVDLCGQVDMICISTKTTNYYECDTANYQLEDSLVSNICPQSNLDVNVNIPKPVECNYGAIPKEKNYRCQYFDDPLRFHKKAGSLIKLSASRRSAQRRHPLDEFNNGVVMTHRCLRDNELFEIRIDRLVDKWSGSIEMGVTTHDPGAIEFPATMTNMRSGTIMMSGCGILTNGRGTRREYGNYNLDQLQTGHKVGLVRMQNGDLHYFINGNDQGVAATRVNQHVWGVVDLYGMTVKVSIIEQGDQYLEEAEDTPDEEAEARPTCSRLSIPILPPSISEILTDNKYSPEFPMMLNNMLAFHPFCGPRSSLMNIDQTAYRIHADAEYVADIVFTRRPLKNDELFEIAVVEVVAKWICCLKFGVTTHHPCRQYSPVPLSISSLSDVWAMTNIGAIHNSDLIHKMESKYGNFEVGDCFGVMRQSSGVLKFFINKVDMGISIPDVPPNVFGVVDLSGRASRVSIVHRGPQSPDSLNSSYATIHGSGDLIFQRQCGGNLKLNKTRTVATRIFADVFVDNILVSCRSLRECEMFQVRIDKKRKHPGVTLVFAVSPTIEMKTMPIDVIDLSRDIYLLERDRLYYNKTFNKYSLHLSNVPEGSLIGVMRHADRSVHFYLDGVDQGKAWTINSHNLYAILELNGYCTQVSIVPPDARAFGNSENSQLYTADSSQKLHCFSEYCGSNIVLSNDLTLACVKSSNQIANLVFSSSTLKPDETFQFQIILHQERYAGSIRIGVTDVNVLNAHINKRLPNTLDLLPANTMFMECNWITACKNSLIDLYPFNLNRLRTKDVVGLRRIAYTGFIVLFVNFEEVGIIFKNVPLHAFLAFELRGPVTAIKAVSTQQVANDDKDENAHSLHSIESLHIDDELHSVAAASASYHHGCNIEIDTDAGVIRRPSNYNHGIIIKNQSIHKGQSFQFNVLKINNKWDGTLMVGVGPKHSSPNLPATAVNLKGTWMVSMNHLFLSGYMTHSQYGKDLVKVKEGSKITIQYKETGDLVMLIDEVNYGSYAKLTDTNPVVYPIVDVYAICEEISLPIVTFTGNKENTDDMGRDKSLGDEEKADLEYREKEYPERGESTLDVNVFEKKTLK